MWKYFEKNKPPFGKTIISIDCVTERYFVGKHTRDGFFKGIIVGFEVNHWCFLSSERMSRWIFIHEYVLETLNQLQGCNIKNK